MPDRLEMQTILVQAAQFCYLITLSQRLLEDKYGEIFKHDQCLLWHFVKVNQQSTISNLVCSSNVVDQCHLLASLDNLKIFEWLDDLQLTITFF